MVGVTANLSSDLPVCQDTFGLEPKDLFIFLRRKLPVPPASP
jgi:hypothetical protein